MNNTGIRNRRVKAALLMFVVCSSVIWHNAYSQSLRGDKSSGMQHPMNKATLPLVVKRCSDFVLTGKDGIEWEKTQWNTLTKLDTGGRNYPTSFKIMYSSTGIYVFFRGVDEVITTTYDQDFGNLFRGDVFEVFFQTEPKTPVYLEYEVNALDKELVLLIPNYKTFQGWTPWNYDNKRRVKKVVRVEGGEVKPGSRINAWSAELFFPYDLFKPLENVPPASGTVWHANFYRLDYDDGNMKKYAWSPIDKSFHEFKKFAQLRFE